LFSALSGWSKLRKRDMSALLEACGWAVNFRMYMTRRLGHLFSHTPRLPEGARKERRDRVTLFLRQAGYGASRWTRARVGLVSLLAALLTVALLSALFWNEIKALLQGWLSG
ncbi:MAG: kinesin, partial [Gemmatimonadetes bacterium]|nr:kinesin [Gemmatimonadota bacterium]